MISQVTLQQYLDQDSDFAVVYRHVRQAFDVSNLTAHNWEHTFRDICNAIAIGEAEQANMRIVLPSITMHDIGFLYGATSKEHGAVGADKLREFIAPLSLTYSEVELDHIAACIRTHKGSAHQEEPATLEAKVVADADFLEKFGPLGVYQVVRTYTEFNLSLQEILDQKDRFTDLKLETTTGQQMADERRQFVIDFYQSLATAYRDYPNID